MIPQSVTDIYFDLDHTLWDFDANSNQAFATLLAAAPFQVELADFLKVYEPINAGYWSRYRMGEIDHDTLRYGRFESTLQALEIGYQPQWITEFAHGYLEELPKHNLLIEGADQLLRVLNPQFALHIITNGFTKVQLRKLEASGIASFFTTVTDSESAGYKKPQAEIFLSAMQKNNVLPSKALMVGDDLEADVRGAQKAGMHAVLFDRYNQFDAEATPRVQTLTALSL